MFTTQVKKNILRFIAEMFILLYWVENNFNLDSY